MQELFLNPHENINKNIKTLFRNNIFVENVIKVFKLLHMEIYFYLQRC